MHNHGFMAVTPSFLLNQFDLVAFLKVKHILANTQTHYSNVSPVSSDPFHFDAETKCEIRIFANSSQSDRPLAIINLAIDTRHLAYGNSPFCHTQSCLENDLIKLPG